MKKWELQNKFVFEVDSEVQELIKVLLSNRGIENKDTGEFLNPEIESITAASLGISKADLKNSLERIKKAIKEQEMIVVFGDYDVDGVTGTAILWETLNSLGARTMPYIPHRVEEGYGLSKKGIENLKEKYPDVSLIITTDNGIVAHEPVEFASSLGIDVIVTDHHVPSEKNPKAHSIIHSTKICGGAVAWFFARYLEKEINKKTDFNMHLDLVVLATVADMMQLKDFNRTLLKHGLTELKKTKRVGLTALFKYAAIDVQKLGVYEIGHIIAPRLNAMGRIEHAMDSLRLICTKDSKRADDLAQKLNSTNTQRQQLTLDSFLHAKGTISEKTIKKILFVAHESYEPGVIGLIAGKLTEEFYRPSIVLSIGEKYTKASARSVSGFNIIEFIRSSSDLLVDAGGHPMAAGFTVETKNMAKLQALLEKLAEEKLDGNLLHRSLKIDCELGLESINDKLYSELNSLSPFGYGNPEPVFLDREVTIENMQSVGTEKKHMKLKCTVGECRMNAIMFNFQNLENVKVGDKIDIVYSITLNEWNGTRSLELKIKDLKKI